MIKQDITESEKKQYKMIIEEKLLVRLLNNRSERARRTGVFWRNNCNRLKEYLRQRLIECGWKEELKSLCKGLLGTLKKT
jgi:hypothetical protein